MLRRLFVVESAVDQHGSHLQRLATKTIFQMRPALQRDDDLPGFGVLQCGERLHERQTGDENLPTMKLAAQVHTGKIAGSDADFYREFGARARSIPFQYSLQRQTTLRRTPCCLSFVERFG